MELKDLLNENEDKLFEEFVAAPTINHAFDRRRFVKYVIVSNANRTGFRRIIIHTSSLLIGLILCFIFLACSSQKPSPNDLATVYICTGESSTCYHATDGCSSLSGCTGEIKHIGLRTAKKTRKPCSRCYDVSEGNAESGVSLPKYVYRDNNGTVHYDEKCIRLRHLREDGVNNKAYIELSDYQMLANEKFCTYCISDSIYETLKDINDRNQSEHIYCDTVAIESDFNCRNSESGVMSSGQEIPTEDWPEQN